MSYADTVKEYEAVQAIEDENLEWANSRIEGLQDRVKELETQLTAARMLCR